MLPTPNRDQRAFFWQGLLIVLPVFVLAGLGFFSLRQDRILARHEAAERAQTIAEQLAQAVWAEVTEAANPHAVSFKVDQHGQLVSPRPCPVVPAPRPIDSTQLNSEQEQLWRAAQRLEQEESFAPAIQALQNLRNSSLSQEFAGAACYRLGLLHLREGNRNAAAEMFELVLEKYPRSVGESGVPLEPLARLKLLSLVSQGTNVSVGRIRPMLDSLCSNAVFYPSPITTLVLKMGSDMGSTLGQTDIARRWQSEWDGQQLALELYAAARLNLQPQKESDAKLPRLFWISTLAIPGINPVGPAQDWLAARGDEGTNGSSILCTSNIWDVWQRFAGSPVTKQAAGVSHSPARLAVPIPDYFGASLEVAGRTVASSTNLLPRARDAQSHADGSRSSSSLGAATRFPILAAAKKNEDGVEYLRCNVHLLSPERLFARQRQRTALFGLLIGVSSAAALVGFVAARRAFYRQLRLAELKTNFVSSVSHELRAPIASVRLMAEGLERGRIEGPAKQNEYFRFIVQECRRLSSMIENVLDFSRIEQGRKQYEFEPVDLRALVEQTTKLMSTQAVERQIRLETVITGKPIFPEVDGQAIQQALVNLMDNALKHSPSGSSVTVGLEFPSPSAAVSSEPKSAGALPPGASEGAILRLWVEDHGEGIPPAEHARIFERFYRCGSELRRETQGVGIGLSIVKHIVEAHRGRIMVRSAPGQGSRFTVDLPIKNRSTTTDH